MGKKEEPLKKGRGGCKSIKSKKPLKTNPINLLTTKCRGGRSTSTRGVKYTVQNTLQGEWREGVAKEARYRTGFARKDIRGGPLYGKRCTVKRKSVVLNLRKRVDMTWGDLP